MYHKPILKLIDSKTNEILIMGFAGLILFLGIEKGPGLHTIQAS